MSYQISELEIDAVSALPGGQRYAQFLERVGWLPGMRRDGRAAAVFPVPNAGSVLVEAERLRVDLDTALEPYD